MKEHLRPSIVILVLMTVLTGLAYPLAMTGLAAILFPEKSRGSVISKDGKEIGSSLIGQPFDHPAYFWGRLSATSPVPYTAFNAEKGTGSSGSNLGPLNPALREAAQSRLKALQTDRPVPADLVTASASGLDPHLSLQGIEVQVDRVARARGVSPGQVRELISKHTEPRTLGILGEPRVNVLELNLDLDARFGKPKVQ